MYFLWAKGLNAKDINKEMVSSLWWEPLQKSFFTAKCKNVDF
jgi:hypothetical protein